MGGKLVEAETDCKLCGQVDRVFAVAEVQPHQRRLWAFCPKDPTGRLGHSLTNKFLDCDSYVAEFPELERQRAHRPAKYRIGQARRYQILQRDGYRCVFCRYAIERRQHPGDVALAIPEVLADVLADERARGLASPMPVGAVPAKGTVEDVEERVLFHVDADHVFPVDWFEELSALVDPKDGRTRIMRKCGKEWIVATCPACNGGRYWYPDSPRTMLGVYARHLYGLQKDPEADLQDLLDFAKALRSYAYLRTTRLKPRKPASATG
jgi:hypothetical protein